MDQRLLKVEALSACRVESAGDLVEQSFSVDSAQATLAKVLFRSIGAGSRGLARVALESPSFADQYRNEFGDGVSVSEYFFKPSRLFRATFTLAIWGQLTFFIGLALSIATLVLLAILLFRDSFRARTRNWICRARVLAKESAPRFFKSKVAIAVILLMLGSLFLVTSLFYSSLIYTDFSRFLCAFQQTLYESVYAETLSHQGSVFQGLWKLFTITKASRNIMTSLSLQANNVSSRYLASQYVQRSLAPLLLTHQLLSIQRYRWPDPYGPDQDFSLQMALPPAIRFLNNSDGNMFGEGGVYDSWITTVANSVLVPPNSTVGDSISLNKDGVDALDNLLNETEPALRGVLTSAISLGSFLAQKDRFFKGGTILIILISSLPAISLFLGARQSVIYWLSVRRPNKERNSPFLSYANIICSMLGACVFAVASGYLLILFSVPSGLCTEISHSFQKQASEDISSVISLDPIIKNECFSPGGQGNIFAAITGPYSDLGIERNDSQVAPPIETQGAIDILASMGFAGTYPIPQATSPLNTSHIIAWSGPQRTRVQGHSGVANIWREGYRQVTGEESGPLTLYGTEDVETELNMYVKRTGCKMRVCIVDCDVSTAWASIYSLGWIDFQRELSGEVFGIDRIIRKWPRSDEMRALFVCMRNAAPFRTDFGPFLRGLYVAVVRAASMLPLMRVFDSSTSNVFDGCAVGDECLHHALIAHTGGKYKVTLVDQSTWQDLVYNQTVDALRLAHVDPAAGFAQAGDLFSSANIFSAAQGTLDMLRSKFDCRAAETWLRNIYSPACEIVMADIGSVACLWWALAVLHGVAFVISLIYSCRHVSASENADLATHELEIADGQEDVAGLPKHNEVHHQAPHCTMEPRQHAMFKS
eukprot:Gregarina_sp_Poly_1__1625@NODE_1412_length_4204_cov_50_655064_g941_i0_p1_GENE_NODE_1412_length_4204_cov_50_655064_g941_i0NODE_1412_length_4204_cov_50_655064_g941_i0_p1_ORF_typecomplete_len878_score73_25_NODE_1412_length_4204_cov_50_655064_g941_i013954028